ncbi:lysosome membrane protein 2-like, partial [Pollicipes pollicipes]|uniref:lysosome membrane protein 2-like n=1 Tax=Pollicipes pollicipes TaxID=41117 RepID=UPI001885772F
MQTNVKVGITAFVGVTILIFGCVLGWYGFPVIIDNMLEESMVLTPTSASFEPWRAPTDKVSVYMQFIMFNVTNAEEVRTAGAKPQLQEVGPFSYRESRQRGNLSWSADGTELTYSEQITYVFDAESSAANVSQDTAITTINAPVLMLQQLVEAMPLAALLRPLVSAAMGPLLEQPFVSVPVRELLFEGSPVPALRRLLALPGSGAILDGLCGRGLCGSPQDLRRLQAGRFPSMMYNNSWDGPYKIRTGKGDIEHFTYIQSYKGSSSLDYWGTPFCNMLNGTDGITYPPHMERSDRMYIFNKDLCRSIYLDYERDVEYFGISGRRYVPERAVLEDPAVNVDNRCFCTPPGQCLKAGAMSLSPCQFGAPIVASTPHFFNGDPEYVNSVVGLAPDKLHHETFIDIEPLTGLALNGGKKIQINIDLARFDGLSSLGRLPRILFPVMYTNETARID